MLTINNSSSSVDTITTCDSYTWINGVTYTSSNNTAKDTLTNAIGCDSIISLNLTINNVNNGVSISGNIITATETGATYQWLDCGNSMNIIAREVLQSFRATTSGNYAVEITKNGCVDTSLCSTIVLTNILENPSASLNISPNPFNNFIQVENIELQKVQVNIFDVSGKEYTNVISIKNNRIYTSDLPSGVYFLQINGKTSKIIKN